MLIRAIRQRTGLTQEKLATRLGVTFPTVNRWEHGRVKPSPLALLRIKELIGTMASNGLVWPTEDGGRLPEYKQEMVFIDAWPVLEQGTD